MLAKARFGVGKVPTLEDTFPAISCLTDSTGYNAHTASEARWLCHRSLFAYPMHARTCVRASTTSSGEHRHQASFARLMRLAHAPVTAKARLRFALAQSSTVSRRRYNNTVIGSTVSSDTHSDGAGQEAGMRVHAVSDLHADYAQNLQWCAAHPAL